MHLKLIIVVVIATFAAGCGFGKYKCKSMQTEAKSNLMSLRTGMEMVKAETNAYPKTLEAAEFAPMGKYYDYKLVKADDAGFLAEAVGKGDMAGDQWKVDQGGTVTAVKDKCN